MKLRFTIRWMKMVRIYFQGNSQNNLGQYFMANSVQVLRSQ